MKKDTQIFVNLPVKNLDKSIKFFSRLGFKFNPKFTDKNATCMIISKDIYAMLLVENFFKTFIKKKKISDAKKNTEVLIAISLPSNKAVDKMVNMAVKSGGKEVLKYDHGWMYGRDFEDLDGHIWEIFHMDESKMKK
jgi:uncharacterized protein